MTFKQLERSKYDQKFKDWQDRVEAMHHDFDPMVNTEIAWTPLTKPLTDCVVALGTTCGVHLKQDEPFDQYSEHGDQSFRLIGNNVQSSELMASHNHFNTDASEQDINCIFPIDRLRELAEQGVLQASPMHFGFMGFNPKPARLLPSTNKVIKVLKECAVDVVIMTPG